MSLDEIRKVCASFKNAPKLEKIIMHNVSNIIYVSTK